MKIVSIKKLLFIALLAFTLGLMGCRTEPVYNVQDSPVNTVGKISKTNVKKAIMAAGAGLGWRMKEVKPGHIVGSIMLRGNTATVDIPYTTKTYSIVYKNSNGLKYDGSKINKQYNKWIMNLDNAIQQRLIAM
jgi:PBP1b-binding outer membrane lipoprotein LpoB